MGLKRNVGPHRVPGICISLMGFVILFAGIMMVAMAQTSQNINKTEVNIGGGVCLVLGAASVTGGFFYQFIVHREFKKKKMAKEQRRKANREIISARATAYLENNPMEGTSGSMVDLSITSPRFDEFGSSSGLPNPMDDDDIMADEENGEFKPYDIFQVAFPGQSEDTNGSRTPATPRIICQTIIDETNSSSDEEYEHRSRNNVLNVDEFVVERSTSQPSMKSSDIGSSTCSVGNRSVVDDSDEDVSIPKLTRKQRGKNKLTGSTISVARTGSSVSIRSSRSDLNETLKDLDEELESSTITRRKKRKKKLEAKSMDESPQNAVQATEEDLTKPAANNLRNDVQKTNFRNTSKGKATAGSRVKGIYAKKSDLTSNNKQQNDDADNDVVCPNDLNNGVVEQKSSEKVNKIKKVKETGSDTENWDTECSDSDKDIITDKFQIHNGVIEHSPSVIEKHIEEENQVSVIPIHDIQLKRTRLQKDYSNWDSEYENDFSDADTITINGGISDTMPDMSLPDLGAETCDSRCS